MTDALSSNPRTRDMSTMELMEAHSKAQQAEIERLRVARIEHARHGRNVPP